MTTEQWIGVACTTIGIYFVICASLFPEFVLDKLKVARAEGVFGERAAHRFYLAIGMALILGGTIKAFGVF